MSTITNETIILTAEKANEFLLRNQKNRPVKSRVMEDYKRAMLAGNWRYTGEAIKIDGHGTLLDGQHRCMALVAANADLPEGAEPITIKVLVIRGLDPEAQDVMDSGTRRSVADQLSIRGSHDHSKISAAIRCILAYKLNTDRPPREELIKFYDENRETLEKGAKICSYHSNTSGVSPSAMLGAWFLIQEVSDDEDAITMFFHDLQKGTGLTEGSPIWALRNRAMNAKLKRETISNTLATVMVVRTWNSHRNGKPMSKSVTRTRGAKVEIRKIES